MMFPPVGTMWRLRTIIVGARRCVMGHVAGIRSEPMITVVISGTVAGLHPVITVVPGSDGSRLGAEAGPRALRTVTVSLITIVFVFSPFAMP